MKLVKVDVKVVVESESIFHWKCESKFGILVYKKKNPQNQTITWKKASFSKFNATKCGVWLKVIACVQRITAPNEMCISHKMNFYLNICDMSIICNARWTWTYTLISLVSNADVFIELAGFDFGQFATCTQSQSNTCTTHSRHHNPPHNK